MWLVTMLGDMFNARAAAENPPASTTFTNVAMLVMRSIGLSHHPDDIEKSCDYFLHSQELQQLIIRGGQVEGRVAGSVCLQGDRQGGTRCSASSTANSRRGRKSMPARARCATRGERSRAGADS